MSAKETIYWTCCQCGYGPHILKIHQACSNSNCQHRPCINCQSYYLNEDLTTNATDQPISYANDNTNVSSTRVLPDPNGKELRDCSSIHSPTCHPSTYFDLGEASEGSPLAVAPASAIYESLPPTPNLLPSEHVTTLPEHFASGPTYQPSDGEWLWVCSECGGGSWLLSNVGACLHCGHQRCIKCPCWEVN